MSGNLDLQVIARMEQRTRPIYSLDEASDYLGIPVNTIRAWAIGRPKRKNSGESYPPVLDSVNQKYRRLSFFDLVEAHILRAAIEKRVPLRNIKKGLEFVRARFPNEPRPLLSLKFKTDGKNLLIGGMLGSDEKDQEALVNASRDGQLVMTAVIEEYLQLIGWAEDGLPDTLFPKEGRRVISITSGILSGRPVIEGTRIPTSVVAQRFMAGEKPSKLAMEYHLPEEKIEAAIEFEKAA